MSLRGLTERIYDEAGNLLIEERYEFKRLFAEGQLMIINSVRMTVLSCKRIDSIIETRVRLHSPWKKDDDEAEARNI